MRYIPKHVYFLFIACGTLCSTWLFSADTAPMPPAEPPVQPMMPHHDMATPAVPPPSYEFAFVKMLATLAGLLLLVFLTVWLLRRLTNGKIGAFGSNKKIKVLERRPLSPKTILYVVDVAGKQVLVAESQLEVKALAELDAVAEDD